MTSVIQNAVDALALGSLYALFALGIALIFSVMRVINLAHGELIMVAGYALVVATSWPAGLRVVFAIAAVMVISAVLQRAVFKPLRRGDTTTVLVGSLAVSSLLQSTALVWRGPTPQAPSNITILTKTIHLGAIRISSVSVFSIVITALLLGTLTLVLRRTDFGLRMRAAAEDFGMAQMLGVRADRVMLVAFLIAGLLAAVGGVLLVSETGTVIPTVGTTPMLFGLIACVLGGLGRLDAAVLGGFVLGIASVILSATLPLSISPYGDAILFGAVFVVILVRPEGLLRSDALRERV